MKLQSSCLKLCAALSVILTLFYLDLLPGKHDDISQKNNDLALTTSNFSEISGERAIQARMARIRAVCKKHGNPNFGKFNMYYLPAARVTWAPVFKAGSSTWKRFFIDQEVAANHTTNKNGDYRITSLDPKFKLENMKTQESGGRVRQYSAEPEDSVRFTTVRHPLARLVSHYRNSVHPKEVKAQWNIWIRDAILQSRGPQNVMTSEERERNITGAGEYVMRRAAQTDQERSDPPIDNPFLNPPYATFSEMVGYIIRQQKKGVDADGHWMPASQWLDICQNDFDYVVKLESVFLETPYLLSKLNLTEHSELYISRANASGGKSATIREIERYLRQLTSAQQDSLNKIYNFDYEVFGYEPISA